MLNRGEVTIIPGTRDGDEARAEFAAAMGKEIRERRAKARLTQEQLAARMGVTRETVRLAEAGNRIPDPPTLVLFAEVLAEGDVGVLFPKRRRAALRSVGRP